MIKLSKPVLIISSLIYIYIPIVIFLFGWTHFIIATISTGALGYGIYKFIITNSKNIQKKDEVNISIAVLIWSIIFLLFIGYCAGWGNYTEQAGDWSKHNTILKDLMERSWPVYYINNNEHSMLTYYIGQYMVPAAIGKIFHSFRVAEVVNFLWAEIGLVLVYLNMVRVLNLKDWRIQCLSSILLSFFCGPLILAQHLGKILYPDAYVRPEVAHWFIYSDFFKMQYSSNFVMLRWVYPQVIVIWLMVLLFLENKENIEHYLIIFLPGALYGILSFGGCVLLAIGYAIFILIRDKDIVKWLKQVFSLSNIAVMLTFGVTIIVYYYGNIFSDKPHDISFQVVQWGKYWGLYVIFCGIMIVPFVLCLWKRNKKNALFYIMCGNLFLIPLFQMGEYNDWMMRCSIPCLFLLCTFVISFLNDYLFSDLNRKVMSQVSILILLTLLGLGLFHEFPELVNVVVSDELKELGTEHNYGTMERFANRYDVIYQYDDVPIEEDLRYNYYSYDIEQNLFYKYWAREGLENNVQ